MDRLMLAGRVLPGLLAAAGLLQPAAAALCTAQSGARTLALVELYTSEGCERCPRAERWLASLRAQGYGADRVAPLALHAEYRDYTGLRDPYAKRVFAARQRKLAQLQRATLVFTPQVLLQGEGFLGWDSPAFAAAVAAINRRLSRARLGITLHAIGAAVAEVELAAELLDGAQRKDAALYLAAYEDKRASRGTAGKHRATTPDHEFVVREWLGPIRFEKGLKITERRSLPLLPGADPKHSGVAAFVQNRASREVLQALMLEPCS